MTKDGLESRQALYNQLYQDAQDQGWQGWGGDERIAKGPEQVAQILSKAFVSKAGRVLELGCGEGHLCRLLAAQGYDVTGVDISAVAIAWAQAKQAEHLPAIRFLQADISQPELLSTESGTEPFDLIVDGNCLHCILPPQRQMFLANVFRLLSEQGIFFVSSLCSQTETQILNQEGLPYRYILSPDLLELELIEAGFKILESELCQRTDFDHLRLFCSKAR
jgi:2-polyprenyl-3-methyl-5-hydroxy-6-metoxy-1,4-benzoquinol methylase